MKNGKLIKSDSIVEYGLRGSLRKSVAYVNVIKLEGHNEKGQAIISDHHYDVLPGFRLKKTGGYTRVVLSSNYSFGLQELLHIPYAKIETFKEQAEIRNLALTGVLRLYK